MPALKTTSPEYQRKIEEAVIQAIITASMDTETGTAAILSGEVVQACLNVVAIMAATSEVTDTPASTRKFTDEAAKTLRSRIAAVREQRAAGNLDFLTVVSAANRH